MRKRVSLARDKTMTSDASNNLSPTQVRKTQPALWERADSH